MKSVRRNVFETNSSSTHSLSIISNTCESDADSFIPKCEKFTIGDFSEIDFLNCNTSTKFRGFRDKLHCLLAFLICYYEDKVEYCNFERLREKFQMSCHYLWVCELLKDKYNIEILLRDFRYSGVAIEDDFFESLNLPLFYPSEFKKRVDEILSNPYIVLEYICEDW